jgi:MFS family permease
MTISSSAAPGHTRELILGMSTALCYGIAIGLFPALLSLNLDSNGFDTSWSGLLGATPALAGMAVVPFSPQIVARFGARPTYLAAAALTIATSVLFPVIRDLSAWFLLRFLMGVGISMQFAVGEAWINNLAAGPRRGRILSLYVVMICVGLCIGPSIMSLAGITGHKPFLAAAGIYALSCLPVLLARSMKPSAQGRAMVIGFLEAMMRKPTAMLSGLVDGFVFQTLLVFLPIYVLRLGADEGRAIEYLTVFMFGGIPLQFLVGYLLDRFGSEAVLVLTSICIVLGLPALARFISEPLAAWPILIVLGACSAAIYTAGVTAVSGAFTNEEMQSGTATFNVTWYIGGISGPAIAGYAMTIWNPHGLAGTVIVSGLVLGIANAFARLRRKNAKPA